MKITNPRICLVTLLFLVCSVSAVCINEIPSLVQSVLTNPAHAHSTWRVNISYVNDDKLVSVFSHLSDTFGIPASNNKVFTTVAAYTLLGPSFHTSTVVSLLNPSTLCFRASGDATMSHDGLNNLAWQVKELVKEKARGSQSKLAEVDLVVDDSLFGNQEIPDDWEWSDLWFDYGAPPAPSVLEHNTVSLLVTPGLDLGSPAGVSFVTPQDVGTVQISNKILTGDPSSSTSLRFSYRLSDPLVLVLEGSIPGNSTPVSLDPIAVHQPALRLALAFRNHLANYGVQVKKISTTNTPLCKDGTPNVSLQSPSLSTIMNHTLQTSDNLEAEIFMRLLGAQAGHVAKEDNYEAGQRVVRETLVQLGVDVSLFHQTDGSGLSRSNLVQADAEVDVLFRMIKEKQWISFLPVGGVSGTLKNRFIGTPAEGRIHAKTGSMTGVNALSGYLFARDFPSPLVFSFLVNDSLQRNEDVRKAIDDIVVYLSRLENC